VTASDLLLALLKARDERDSFERACGWLVLAYHADMPRETWIAHGPFQEVPAALAYAHERAADMERSGGEGFHFDVLPLMPYEP
jgi:hypothetical protein